MSSVRLLDNVQVHCQPVKAVWPSAGMRSAYFLPSSDLGQSPNELDNADLLWAIKNIVPASRKLQLVIAAAPHSHGARLRSRNIKRFFDREPVRCAA